MQVHIKEVFDAIEDVGVYSKLYQLTQRTLKQFSVFDLFHQAFITLLTSQVPISLSKRMIDMFLIGKKKLLCVYLNNFLMQMARNLFLTCCSELSPSVKNKFWRSKTKWYALLFLCMQLMCFISGVPHIYKGQNVCFSL
jgi:hypothetical protein